MGFWFDLRSKFSERNFGAVKFEKYRVLVRWVLQSATAITKCDKTALQSRTVELPKYGYMHVGTEKTYMEL